MNQSKINILIDENIPLLKECLIDSASVISFAGRSIDNKFILESNSEALIVRSTTKVNKELLKNTKIKLVGTATSGTEHIDIEYLNENSINFVSALGANANSVAEYVIYNILKWSLKNEINLTQKTIGIIGFGNIGKLVAYYAYNLGLKVIINDPPLRDNSYNFDKNYIYSELNELLQNSDIITNHVPLNFETKYATNDLLNNNLELIKEDSLFIHTSRGGVVNEDRLIDCIKKNQIKAVIDVWQNEPDFNHLLAESAYFKTPHIAGYSFNGKINGALIMAKAIEKVFNLNVDFKPFQIDETYKQDEKIKSENELLERIERSRHLYEDDKSFSEIIRLPNDVKISKFDYLRKSYKHQNEFLSQKSEFLFR
jgi:erythronate-4-phosphate dehydrogenase